MACNNCNYINTSQIPVSGDLTCGNCQKLFSIPPNTLANSLDINTNGQHVFEITTIVECPHCHQPINHFAAACQDKPITLLEILITSWFTRPVIITNQSAS